MVLKKEIKEKLNEYFQKKLGASDYKNGWMKLNCPSCGEYKYGIHISKDRTNCFKCGYNPNCFGLIMEIEKLHSYQEVKGLLSNLTGIRYTEVEVEKFELKEVILPEGYRNLNYPKGRLGKAARKYLSKRGFDVNELAMAGFGYGTKGKYFGYLIMPYYDDNKLVYFTTRLFITSGPKFNNPPLEDFGIGKNELIYNKDALYLYDKVFLVESITNARTLGDNAIAIGGKVLSKRQFQDIIRSPVKKLIIGLDRDAILYSIDIAFMLIDYKKVKIMVMPNEKDINDIGKKKSLVISHKAKYLSYQSLQKLKNNYIHEHRS